MRRALVSSYYHVNLPPEAQAKLKLKGFLAATFDFKKPEKLKGSNYPKTKHHIKV